MYSIEKKEKWTYEKLIESESLKKFISSILKQLKEKIELNLKNNEQYEFEWCIMVDNSGSMSSKETFVAETLVVLIEVLRRLEHKFAIARFGNKNDKRALLKDFKTPISINSRNNHNSYDIKTNNINDNFNNNTLKIHHRIKNIRKLFHKKLERSQNSSLFYVLCKTNGRHHILLDGLFIE